MATEKQAEVARRDSASSITKRHYETDAIGKYHPFYGLAGQMVYTCHSFEKLNLKVSSGVVVRFVVDAEADARLRAPAFALACKSYPTQSASLHFQISSSDIPHLSSKAAAV